MLYVLHSTYQTVSSTPARTSQRTHFQLQTISLASEHISQYSLSQPWQPE